MNYLIEIIDAKYIDGYRILMTFNNGIRKIIDLKDELWGPIFEPLKDIEYFKTFSINKELGTIQWPNEVDLAPDGLYEIGKTIEKSNFA
jgi:hypothetical protein